MGKLVCNTEGFLPTYKDEGIPLSGNIRLNFVGSGVTATVDPQDPEQVNVSISGGAAGTPTGPAGGDLTGTYPDPTIGSITETGSFTQLAIGGLLDGQAFVRVGTSLAGQYVREVPLMFSRNSTVVTGGTYLRIAGNVSSAPGASPPKMPLATNLFAAIVSVDGAPGSPWDVDIRVNGSTVATLFDGVGTSDFISDTGLGVSIAANDEINVRLGTTSATVSRPTVMLLFRR